MAHHQRRAAFTLIEVLVVIGLIGLLLGVLLPALSSARLAARKTECAANLHNIGVAIIAYTIDNRGSIPFGPDAPPYTATNFYPVTGTVTSLISLQSGKPVGLGLLLNEYLSATPRALFCPAADQDVNADHELSLVGKYQAQSDYYYRHASGASLMTATAADHLQLVNLGLNLRGQPIRSLVIDQNYLVNSAGAAFGVYTRSNHRRKDVNALWSDGRVSVLDNSGGDFTVDATRNVYDSFQLILNVFENADSRG